MALPQNLLHKRESAATALQQQQEVPEVPQSVTIEQVSPTQADQNQPELQDRDAQFSTTFSYLKPEEIASVAEAYLFAAHAHEGQMRESGEPYITHPLAVAGTLAEWRMDAQVICAALLHDVLEDTSVTREALESKFGISVAELVAGVSKFTRLPMYTGEQLQAENFRKMLLAMARDVRVIFIKIADRIHNLKTLHAVRPAKRRRVALETMEIYAPIANRLGFNSAYQILQDLSFKHLYPFRARVLEKALARVTAKHEEKMNQVVESVRLHLELANIQAKVTCRCKHLYSVYRKMLEKHLRLEEVTDLFGFRLIVSDQSACYLSMGLLHALYKPLPGKVKDYIAIPKSNGYQSLHTTLMGPFDAPLEMQIRTLEMHHMAKAGVASHWTYKDAGALAVHLRAETLSWVHSLLDTQSASDSLELLEHVKLDLFPAEVYVFTPRGKIMVMARGSTALDFAYAVHSDIGNNASGCRINRESAPLRTVLNNGDQVEILTSTKAAPQPVWLSYVISSRARNQIRHALRCAQKNDAEQLGRLFLDQALEQLDLSLDGIHEEAWARFLRDTHAKDQNAIFADVGLGRRLADVVARQLAISFDKSTANNPLDARPAINERTEFSPLPISVIRGGDGAVNMAECCLPIPDDDIVGTMQREEGLVVHRASCPNARSGRWLDLSWGEGRDRFFASHIKILFHHKHGVFAQIASAISAAGANIQKVNMDSQQDSCAVLYFDVQVRDRNQLAKVFQCVHRLPDIVRISRSMEINHNMRKTHGRL